MFMKEVAFVQLLSSQVVQFQNLSKSFDWLDKASPKKKLFLDMHTG